VILFIIPFILILKYNKPYIGIIMLIVVCMMFSTKFINPLSCQYGLWKLFKQQFNIVTSKKDDIIINDNGELEDESESDGEG
jgi:hypothetical protein